MNRDAFEYFLAMLSTDAEEAARRYSVLHAKFTGFFRLKGMADPGSAADETLDRAALNISEGAIVPDAEKYCWGIARNLAKEKFRQQMRESKAIQEFVERISNTSLDLVERIYQVLRPCFEQLSTGDQQLLLSYCKDIRGRQRAEHRRLLAEMLQLSVSALRIKVTRLRDKLTECVRRQQPGHGTSLSEMQ